MSDQATYAEHIYQEYIYKHVNPLEQREEIVRCMDCRWCVGYVYGKYKHCDLFGHNLPTVKPNGFCAWGWRKPKGGE